MSKWNKNAVRQLVGCTVIEKCHSIIKAVVGITKCVREQHSVDTRRNHNVSKDS